jgi:transcriptional regulator with XRE-family HTH domain
VSIINKVVVDIDRRKKIFAKRLTFLRKEKSLSQAELANILGINQTQISKMENGHTLPRWENFFSIIQYFECSSDFLLEETNFPKEERYENAVRKINAPIELLRNKNIEIPDEQATRIIKSLERVIANVLEDIAKEEE